MSPLDDFMDQFGVVILLFCIVLAALAHYIDDGENRRVHEGWDKWRKAHPKRKRIKW